MENKEERSVLLSKYEKIIGYPSNIFGEDEWIEFDFFCIGYNLCKNEEN